MSIQIMKIFWESFRHFNEHKLSWVRIAFAPIVLYLIGFIFLMTAFISMGHDLRPGEMPTGFLPIFAQILNVILSVIAGVSLSINGYRFGILNEGGETWWHLQINMRLVKVILYLLLVGIIVAAYIFLSIGVISLVTLTLSMIWLDVTLGILLVLFGIYALIRLALLIPLIAIDREKPLSTSWHMLKGNVLRLVGLMFLIGLAIAGIVLLGGIVIALIALVLSFISPVLAVIFGIFVGIPFVLYIWLMNFGVLAKAMSEVYLTFTEGGA